MEIEDYDFFFQITLIGCTDSGKSSFLYRYLNHTWIDIPYHTLGAESNSTTIEIDSKKVKMKIWDTNGQLRFRNIVASYLRGAHGVLLFYDVTDRETFEILNDWLIETEKNCRKNILKIIIGNKCDLERDRKITTKEGIDFANKYNCFYG